MTPPEVFRNALVWRESPVKNLRRTVSWWCIKITPVRVLSKEGQVGLAGNQAETVAQVEYADVAKPRLT